MLLRCLALTGVLLAAGCAKRVPPSSEALKLADQCAEALEARELEDARLLCQGATAQAPELARAWQDLGVANLMLGQGAEAKAPLERARALDDQLWRVHNGLGIVAFVAKDYPKADGELKRASELQPQAQQPRYNRAWNYFRWGRSKDAKTELRTLLQKHPDAGPAWHFYGFILLTEDQPADAVEAMLSAIEKEPRSCRNWLGIGSAYYRERRYEEAEEALRTCVEVCPRDVACGAAVEKARARMEFPLAEPADLQP